MGAQERGCPGVKGSSQGRDLTPREWWTGPLGDNPGQKDCLGTPGQRDPVERSLGVQAHAKASLPPPRNTHTHTASR